VQGHFVAECLEWSVGKLIWLALDFLHGQDIGV
jgi:hypothetical protein